ncbi:MAG TPA: hypothetical protein VKY90_08195 [Candidatus Dormibacteraeota bacterium]|nr:hypothetical protein [Candidatus Dormibacteraeota bacterium]
MTAPPIAGVGGRGSLDELEALVCSGLLPGAVQLAVRGGVEVAMARIRGVREHELATRAGGGGLRVRYGVIGRRDLTSATRELVAAELRARLGADTTDLVRVSKLVREPTNSWPGSCSSWAGGWR